ncbi:MAG: hypothetical protein WB511_00630 [Nitrososphaeraceae archaeon]
MNNNKEERWRRISEVTYNYLSNKFKKTTMRRYAFKSNLTRRLGNLLFLQVTKFSISTNLQPIWKQLKRTSIQYHGSRVSFGGHSLS